jgi:hypothetical protein
MERYAPVIYVVRCHASCKLHIRLETYKDSTAEGEVLEVRILTQVCAVYIKSFCVVLLFTRVSPGHSGAYINRSDHANVQVSDS